MKRSNIALALLLLGSWAVLAACGGRPATEPSAKSPEAVFRDKCSRCHGLNVAFKTPHTLEGWRIVVAQEASRWKWLISKKEQEMIANYLYQELPAEKETAPLPPPPVLEVDKPEDLGPQ